MVNNQITIRNEQKPLFYTSPLFCYFAAAGQVNDSKIDSLLTAYHTIGKFNGNAEVIKQGKIICKKSLGYADFDKKVKLNDDSVFYLGSLSKQFSAMCIVILKSKEKLQYDDPVNKYIKDFPFPNVTIRHLLTHSSGIPDYINLTLEQWQKYPNATDKDIVKIISENFDKLEFQPGEKFLYSNSNYSLLVTIIENLSKESYPKFIRKTIFSPLKMKHSFIKTERNAADKSVKGYIKNDSLNRIELPDQLNGLFGSPTYGIIGGGGIFSNLEDLYKWDQALYTNKLVSSKDLNDIFTQYTFIDGSKSRYGFGWNIYHRENGDFVMRHAGQFTGYLSIITRNVSRHESIVLLTNVTGKGDVQNIVALMTQIEGILEGGK